jgi:hypothetical protein
MENLNLNRTGDTATAQAIVIDVGETISAPLGFLDLPREIRDEIYSLLFLSENRIVYPSKARAGSISEAIQLLQMNRTIYSEVVEILYGHNMFQIRGDPAFMAPELLNLLIFQRRKEERPTPTVLRPSLQNVGLNRVCLARHHLRKLSIPSHGISFNLLKHLFSLLKYFPKLEHIQVIYLAKRDLNDMDVVNVCRLLRDRLPLVRTFVLGKRISYSQAEDISWMVSERPYRKWTVVVDGGDDGHPRRLRPGGKEGFIWSNEVDERRQAILLDAPQSIPE